MGRRSKSSGTLQPRGKPLYELEKSSFGSRMLNKMGWSEGKGLGVKLQGDPEFVRIKYKCDADGLGYEDRNDQWTQHEDGFSQLLNNLNSTSAGDAPKPIQSLEEKSKNSRVRVHYMKFTKGKDLSKRSAKELANIFGKASLTVEPKAEVKIEKEDETSEDKSQIYETNTIKSSMSSRDYFKDKLKNKKMNLNSNYAEEKPFFKQELDDYPEDIETKPCFKRDTEEQEENKPKFDDYPEEMQAKPCFKQENCESQEPVSEEIKVKKEKKSKRKSTTEEATVAEPPKEEKKAKKRKHEQYVEPEPEAPKKSKKKQANVETTVAADTKQAVRSNFYTNAIYANDDVEQTVISVDRFAVDKLNFLDLETLWHSNCANIIGYGLTENLNINLLNCQTLQNSKCNKYELYYLMDRKMSQKNINFKMKAKRAVFVPI